jgi:NTP pyrophosphatase (non-canonical NTP hydrolase)
MLGARDSRAWGEELADVAIYLLGVAEMTGVDLQQEVEAKIVKNASRRTAACRMAPLSRTTAD